MNSANRRGFLKIAGAGAAAAGAASLMTAPAASAQIGSSAVPDAKSPAAGLPTDAGSMVAYVHDVADGTLAVMVEGREITVTDHDLVARLAAAVHAASTAAV